MIDFYVVCDKILPLITRMTIDQSGALTKYKGRVVQSDHCRLDLELELEFHKEKKHERQEVFNVKNKTCQRKFYEFTSRQNTFTKCFQYDSEDVDSEFRKWKRLFTKALNACFKKIRATEEKFKELSNLDKLMNEKKEISKVKKVNITQAQKDRIEEIEKLITDECADKHFEKLEKVLGNLESGTGETNSTNVWKEMRKAFPRKSRPLPTGIMNIDGKVITNPDEKKKITKKHFEHRMRKRPQKEEVKEILKTNENVFRA